MPGTAHGTHWPGEHADLWADEEKYSTSGLYDQNTY